MKPKTMACEAVSGISKLLYTIKIKLLLALLALFFIPTLSIAATPSQSITIIADGSGEAILVDGSKLLKGTIKDNGNHSYQIRFHLVGGSPSADTQGVYASINGNDSMLVRSGQMIKGKTSHYGNQQFQTVFTSSNSTNSNVFLAVIILLASLLVGLGIVLYRVNNKMKTYRDSNYKHQALTYNLRLKIKNLRQDRQFHAPANPQSEKVEQAIQEITLPEFKNIKFKKSYLQNMADDGNQEETKV